MRDEELFEDPNTKDRLGPAFSTYKALYDNRIEQNKRKARALMEQKQNCECPACDSMAIESVRT